VEIKRLDLGAKTGRQSDSRAVAGETEVGAPRLAADGAAQHLHVGQLVVADKVYDVGRQLSVERRRRRRRRRLGVGRRCGGVAAPPAQVRGHGAPEATRDAPGRPPAGAARRLNLEIQRNRPLRVSTVDTVWPNPNQIHHLVFPFSIHLRLSSCHQVLPGWHGFISTFFSDSSQLTKLNTLISDNKTTTDVDVVRPT